jgi:hypothetical protein
VRSGSGPGFDRERKSQRERLLKALKSPEGMSENLSEALMSRLAERAMLASRELIALLRDLKLPPDAIRRLEQEQDEALIDARNNAREAIQRMRIELSTLRNLELSAPGDVQDKLAQLDGIQEALDASDAPGDRVTLPAFNQVRDPQVPPDFPELNELLLNMSAFCDDLRKSIRAEQRARLSRLSTEPDRREAAQVLLNRIESLDPVTVDNMIGQVQAGLPVMTLDFTGEDDFEAYFPRFVEAMAVSPLNRGDILDAIVHRKRIGPLDYTSHDDLRVSLAKRLLEAWATGENAFRQSSPDKLRKALEELFGLIGFTSAGFSGDRELISGRLRSLRMKSDVPAAGRWFLPPVFGSDADGQYPVLLARSEVQDEQLSAQLGQIGRDRPCLLLIFGRLDRRRRESLAHVLRRDRQTALVLDEGLILHLTLTDGSPMEQLFNCAGPFGWLQPYTTNPRAIPPEMFFGRRDEIHLILARESGGCLVYGGRQLGKSALLNHVRRNYDRPQQGQRAVYLDIKPVGGRDTSAAAIWRRIATELAHAEILTVLDPDPETTRAAIRRWLDEASERRLLVMLDEADRFLAAETRAGFPNLLVLKGLMEETAWRFKAVFAGLHNVRRAAQAPNSPLVHLGDPICVGPLDTTPENLTEARRLVVAPMHAAGFAYDPPGIAADILARVNYYPSLVQVFCKSVIENAGKQRRPSGTGPRWLLSRESLFEGQTAVRISQEIRMRFQVTLDLDLRYDLIAKSLALYRLEHGDGNNAVLREGLSAEEIHLQVHSFWPKSRERLRLGDFQALLEEMVDLGVLGRFERNRYGLRNAQVAQMLGQRDSIMEDILRIAEREPEVDYDATVFHRRVPRADPDRRAPLPDRVLARLFAATPGVRILVADPALWGRDLAERLRDLAEDWTHDGPAPSAYVHDGQVAQLRSRVEARRGRRTVIVLRDGWDEQGISWLARHPKIASGDVVPICLAGVNWLSSHLPHQLEKDGIQTFVARPWGEAMLRHWLEDHGLEIQDAKEVRAAVLAASGGAPERIVAMREVLNGTVTDRLEIRLEKIRSWAENQSIAAETILHEDLLRTFCTFAELAETGELTQTDLDGNLGMDGERYLSALIALGFVDQHPDMSYSLTHLGRLVRR